MNIEESYQPKSIYYYFQSNPDYLDWLEIYLFGCSEP